MMETMCRVDRSFQPVDNGKIVLQGDDPRASVFLASAKHVVPGTLNLDKKDVSTAPNVFIPAYRDLDIPAVCKVIGGVSYGGFYLSGRHILGFRALTATTPSPFNTGSYMRYGGCRDPTLDGDHAVFILNGNQYPSATTLPNPTSALMPTPDGTRIKNVLGGYLGSDDGRFGSGGRWGVQHQPTKKMKAARAPGLTPQWVEKRVSYDCENSPSN